LVDASTAPFFLDEVRHTFQVDVSRGEADLPPIVIRFPGLGGGVGIPKIPPIVRPPVVGRGPKTPPVGPVGPVGPVAPVGPVGRGPIRGQSGDDAAIRTLVSEDAYIRTGLDTGGTVRFGSVDIGPAGAVVATPTAART
jgi:hypothetical protein